MDVAADSRRPALLLSKVLEWRHLGAQHG